MKDELLALLSSPTFTNPLTYDELVARLDLKNNEDKDELSNLLIELEKDYIITHNKKNGFALIEYFGLAYGILEIKTKGYGFVDTPNESYFIKESDLNNALSHDEVLIKIIPGEGKLKRGIVERIIKRGNEFIYGILKKYHNKYYLRSIDPSIRITIYIHKENLNNADVSAFVKVKILKYFPNNTADGKIIEILPVDPYNDLKGIALSHNIDIDFSNETYEEIKDIPKEVRDEELINRRIICDKIITIDDLSAKDLDDAVTVSKNSDGTYKLGVYIADVSHYVKDETFLDLDAFNRGTSVYLPNMVIPMLPKELSNGICSLNPNVDRLVMACVMQIDNEGNIINYDIFEACIKTTYRMTYEDCNKILGGDSKLINKYKDIVGLLYDAYELSLILNKKRRKRGSFEFNTTDCKIILNDNGKVLNIEKDIRGKSENIIEEFMLAANETVAEVMSYLDVPFLYRVHEAPSSEKINRLALILRSFNYDFKVNNEKSLPKVLQKVLEENDQNEEGISEEEQIKRNVINTMLIRSMAKAKYMPQNIGHFGLQAKFYCHFTSPIRRYPDLMVHRLIKEFLLNHNIIDVSNPLSYYETKVEKAAIVSSNKERIAENVERDALNYKKCEYMERYIGNIYHGVISSVVPFGFFVTLDNTVEGLVRVANIYDDYYEYDEIYNRFIGDRLGITYSLGDKVTIRVIEVNKEERIIDFVVLRKD